MTDSEEQPTILRHVPGGQVCCDPEWEAAYLRFETPEQEIAKFIQRLRRFGFQKLSKESHIAEIFCGRGGGLVALERIGFHNIEGVDLSDSLLEQYQGNATLHLANCMDMPFDDDSFDAVVVHGGLHHLPRLPEDLDRTLSEIARILKPRGNFYAVEPWRTPFLTFAHFVTDLSIMRRFYAKGDALATMTERERATYEQWLGQPDEILAVFARHFTDASIKTRWGKLEYVGRVGQLP
jgi:ubiquinone/menaquinone biosynthesis C-methylase UbiE